MTHCRHLPSGEPHINITLFSTDTILTANVLIITFVSLIESEELTSVQPLHIIPFGYEPWHKITEHCAWNYALHVHWSSFIKKFCFSWIWATFSLYHAHQQSRHAQATQLLLCVSKSRKEKKKEKIIPKKEWIMFFSYCSRPWLTPADAKKSSHISFSCIPSSLPPVLWTVQMFVLLELLGSDLNLTSCLSEL